MYDTFICVQEAQQFSVQCCVRLLRHDPRIVGSNSRFFVTMILFRQLHTRARRGRPPRPP